MRAHITASLVACAVVCGYHSMVFGQTSQPGPAGRSSEKATGEAPPKPEPTSVGTPVGTPVTAVIGPTGGTLTSIDGAVTLEVPAGAVAKNTTFAIQTVTNELPGPVGDAFRITPEGTAFAVPARLTFRYTDEEVEGSTPGLLQVVYQDARGYWRAPAEVTVDEQAHTVSVRTAHLSDWTKQSFARITPRRAVVKVGDHVALTVERCFPMTVPEGVDPAWVCKTFNSARAGRTLDHWSVDGVVGGNATLGYAAPTTPMRERAVYVAPPKAPKHPVLVSVDYLSPHSNGGYLSPQTPGGDDVTPVLKGGTEQLEAEITVVDPNVNCETLRDADELQGGMTFSYNFTGTDPQGHRYEIDQRATMIATMTRVKTPGVSPGVASTWTWKGPARVHPSLFASFGMDGVTQSVQGSSGFREGSEMVVTVRVRDCTYQVTGNASARSITTLEAAGKKSSTKGNTVVGSASSGVRPVKGGASGSGDFPLGPQDREASGRFNSGGFGNTLLAGFKPGDLGAAEVTWVVGFPPVRKP